MMVVVMVEYGKETREEKGEKGKGKTVIKNGRRGRKSKDQWSVRGLCSFLWNAVEIHFYL